MCFTRRTSRRVSHGTSTGRTSLPSPALDEHAEGNRARVLGLAPHGGLRIDGGPGGFGERTVSLVDLAWVLVAADEVSVHGGMLDEARVNRFRYLEGVPRGATRWIDTGWAIAAYQLAAQEGHVHIERGERS